MDKQRRTFLKGAGTVAVVGSTGLLTAANATAAETGNKPMGKKNGGSMDIPKNMTFVTLRDADGYRLGVKTDRGILDVRKAGAALKIKAPTSIDDVIQGRGDNRALTDLVQKAQ